MLDCPSCVHTALPITEKPCCDCGDDGEEYVNVHDALADCRAALCKYQLKYWTLAYLFEDNARLKAVLAPLLSHADSHDYAPPIRLSVRQCREIKEKVNGV